MPLTDYEDNSLPIGSKAANIHNYNAYKRQLGA